jgi:outer membrane protein OmpA-like peptidoglycan-associated protein
MNNHLKVFIGIIVVGVLAIGGYKLSLPYLQDKLQRSSSDAAGTRGTIRIGMDNWIGYFPLCSPEMEKNLRQEGYILSCEDDQADYAGRFKKLKQGDLTFAVSTIDAYLLNGGQSGYPGTIVSVLDESKGGDAIVSRKQALPNLDALKDSPETHIAFTPSSPSEHLLKAVNTHFDLPFFTAENQQWRVETSGSSDALKKLLDGTVNAAVLWEPDVSRALSDPAFTRLIGTEDTDKLIVDILLVERRFSKENPEVVQILLDAYFKTLGFYYANPDQLHRDIKKRDKLDAGQIDSMLQGVEWTSLNENSSIWFGTAGSGQRAGLITAIKSALDILIANKDFNKNPLPQQDPYRITNRSYVSALANQQTGQPENVEKTDTLERPFDNLNDQGWASLKRVGTLKVDPVSFQRSAAILDFDGKKTLDEAAEKLRRYPNFRFLIEGHTGIRGDKKANSQLSLSRSEAVSRYLEITYKIDSNRIRSLGYGGTKPLKQLEGESRRAYAYRLPRVEISLMTEAN